MQTKTHHIIGSMSAICLLLAAVVTFAAKPVPTPDGTGLLTGKVTIAGTKVAIEGATVTAAGSAEPLTAVTGSDGKYTMTPVAGDYNVTATADGYNSQSFFATVRSGKKHKVNFVLSETVAVTGTIAGIVTDGEGTPLVGAEITTSSGGYSDITEDGGAFSMDVAAEPIILPLLLQVMSRLQRLLQRAEPTHAG